jgi:hypothetical protein
MSGSKTHPADQAMKSIAVAVKHVGDYANSLKRQSQKPANEQVGKRPVKTPANEQVKRPVKTPANEQVKRPVKKPAKYHDDEDEDYEDDADYLDDDDDADYFDDDDDADYFDDDDDDEDYKPVSKRGKNVATKVSDKNTTKATVNVSDKKATKATVKVSDKNSQKKVSFSADSVPDPYPFSDKNDEEMSHEIKLNKLKQFLKSYNDEWMGDYNNWRKFTTAFIHAFNGDHYNEYDEICRKFPNYNSKKNLIIWNKIKIAENGYTNSHLAFNSFRYWAKKQNPTEYSKLTKRHEKRLEYVKTLVKTKYTDKWMGEYKNWLIFTMAFKNSFHGNYYDEYDKLCSKFPGYRAENNLKKWGQINMYENSKIGFDLFRHWADQQQNDN